MSKNLLAQNKDFPISKYMVPDRIRLAKIRLCGVHEFSASKLASARSREFVQCEKGCGLEFGEIETLSLGSGVDIEVKEVP